MTFHARPDPERYPRALDTEEQILSAMLVSPDACRQAAAALEAVHFTEHLHARLFEAMQAIVGDGRDVTIATLSASFGANWKEDLGGMTLGQYVTRLITRGGGVAYLEGALDTLKEVWALREILAAAEKPASAGDYNPNRMLRSILDDIDRVRAAVSTKSRRAGKLSDELLAGLYEAEQALKGKRVALASTGLPSLDKLFAGGFHPERVITLAGRPGMCKSALAIQFAMNAGADGAGVAYYAQEMAGKEIAFRAASSWISRNQNARVPYVDLMGSYVTEQQITLGVEAQRGLQDHEIHIDSEGGLTIQEVAHRAERLANQMSKAGKRLGLVVVDHIQNMRAARPQINRYDLLTEITGTAVRIGKDLQCTVLLCSQLNRQVENREDKRPTQADLRESGSIEQDSDVILFPFREAYYVEKSTEYKNGEPEALERFDLIRNTLEIFVDKNRQGPGNRLVKGYCDMAVNRIEESAENRYE
jgi:replicative DNA helicase